MANTFTAPFVQVQKTGSAIATAAVSGVGTNTPTGLVPLGAAAGANGALVTKITAMPRATVTASSLLLYSSKDAGATFQIIDSELMAAYTLAATTAIPETSFGNISQDTPLRLQAGEQLYVGSQVALAAGIQFRSEGGDF
ncbi:hypothetical protein QU617_15605 [Pseudomonas guariconensis]|uniref:hypothetical protein n=1 Tax=Pseudomonas guariconensis TaxID=1288410 RepID=UPI0025A9CC28|nr:hypothetical protein [Pseudomonas guariconensis]MDM9594734.1 hypothetical protein [Pseudomonas guariconensis]MDM9607565.1 hypothetical protein [Pseudomonas guariconensis]MDM9612522.1 hypothetical protein [Pseudomonas guariconensis]